MTTDPHPFDDLDAIPDKLENAIKAITGTQPERPNGMTPGMAGGAAAGVLIGAAINAYYAVAVNEDNGLDVHRALIVALESCARDQRVNVAHALINILVSWLGLPNMVEQVGAHAESAADHLESAYRHLAAGDDDTGEGDPIEPHGVPTDSYAPMSTPSAAIDRLGDAASALGIEPVIIAEPDPNHEHDHPIAPVALMSGIVIGRATMELIDMIASADEHMQAHAAPLWITGFAQGAAFGQPADPDIVAAAALRLVNIIGRWHDNRPDAKYGPAIGALCRAANHAGRAGGLGASDVAVRAEYIANYGGDEYDSARKALAAAEEAVKALKDTGVTM